MPRLHTLLLSTLRTPGWRRSLLVRRALALVLLVLAVVTGLRPVLSDDPRVVVFARDVAAGETLTRDDISVLPVPAHLLPVSAVTDPEEATGQVITAAATSGEVVTGARLLGEGHSDGLGGVGDLTTLVPVRPAEPDIIALLRHGDTVSILSHSSDDTGSEIIAAGGRVVLADSRESPGTLLVALPEAEARAVAAASLTTPLAIVLSTEPTESRSVE